MKPQQKDRFEKAKEIFHDRGGALKTGEALSAGIHPRTLYEMQKSGILEKLSRGLYRLTDLPPLGNPDLMSVALRVPRGVICLISALAYHEITTQLPHEIYLALGRGAEPPRLEHPPIRVFWFSGEAFTEGIETHNVEGVTVRVYSPAKTVADCFKYRNKIGLDVVLEAVRDALGKRRCTVDEIWRYAQICRVTNVLRPYLEAAVWSA